MYIYGHNYDIILCNPCVTKMFCRQKLIIVVGCVVSMSDSQKKSIGNAVFLCMHRASKDCCGELGNTQQEAMVHATVYAYKRWYKGIQEMRGSHRARRMEWLV